MDLDLRYPIGKFDFGRSVAKGERAGLIEEIRRAPGELRQSVDGLTEEQLEMAYRPEGWTVRQVVHHVADSHLNCYTRFRLTLTEDEPAIKGYDEKKWAELPDARRAPVETSLALLDALHERWILLLEAMTDEDWKRTFRHSALGPVKLELILALYAWHGKHHTAHINGLRARMGI